MATATAPPPPNPGINKGGRPKKDVSLSALRIRLEPADERELYRQAGGKTGPLLRKWLTRTLHQNLGIEPPPPAPADTPRQVAQALRAAQIQGRSEGEWYLRISLWLTQTDDLLSFPNAWSDWLAAHPQVWANVRKLLINSPAMAQYCRWQDLRARQAARTDQRRY